MNEQRQGPGTNTGHGWVWERPDGMKARCGGAGMCKACAKDKRDFMNGSPFAVAAADVQTVYLAAVEEQLAIMEALADVSGATALEKVQRLKAWYQNLFIELSNSRPGT